MRVAVDAMGGDHAPLEIVKGALLALDGDPDLSVLLVGSETKVRAALDECGRTNGRLSILNARDIVAMGESPVEALRRKGDTSIQRCVEALRQREVESVVSAGDTGGTVAASTLFTRRLKGVKRHGIAIAVPTPKGRSIVIDVGANIHCKPLHILQYAIMASAYAQEMLGIEDPRVGILSIGEENAKGTDLVKRSHGLLTNAGINFIGNVEGQAVFSGMADVVVCDGFVGNVILKVAEGIAEAFLHTVLGQAGAAAVESPALAEILAKMKQRLDYTATGGAPLLGVDGSVIICHGRSRATAVANAIQVAVDFSRSTVNDRIVEGVAKVGVLSRMAGFFSQEKS